VSNSKQPEFVRSIEVKRLQDIEERRLRRSRIAARYGGSGYNVTHGFSGHGPHPDSIAAEHEDIFEWERERNEEESLGWGGGEY
jgi:hypothetical protein